MTIDNATLSELKELMGDSFTMLIGKYIESTIPKLDEIASNISANDPEAMANAAHAIKSPSNQIGATKLGDLLLEIERIGRDGTIENAEKPLEEARAEFSKVREELENL